MGSNVYVCMHCGRYPCICYAQTSEPPSRAQNHLVVPRNRHGDPSFSQAANWFREGPNVPFTRTPDPTSIAPSPHHDDPQYFFSHYQASTSSHPSFDPALDNVTSQVVNAPQQATTAAPSSRKRKIAAGSSAVSAGAELNTRKRRKGTTANSRNRAVSSNAPASQNSTVFGVGPPAQSSEMAEPLRFGSLLAGTSAKQGSSGPRGAASDVWFATVPVSSNVEPETPPEYSIIQAIKIPPKIFHVALDVLPAQASSVPCERVFSSGKDTDTARRNSMSPKMLEVFQVLKFIFRSERLSFENQWCDTEQGMLESEPEFEPEACRTTVPTSSTCTYQL